ncbi:histone-lysine N-methyltransferase SETDB2 [Pseudophryne corroboree]|uniref:histone-lysine N-methyltransferase SETDB2 n=1 Tax=Pseudophryne corroboree TaxID=495146 RepID=UPI00308153C8
MTWRLNDSLLHNPEINSHLQNMISDYFALNDHPDISRSTLWLAHKAVLRGHLISLASKAKKQTLSQYNRLSIKLHALETLHKASSDPTVLSELRTIKAELDLLLTTRVAKRLKNSLNQLVQDPIAIRAAFQSYYTDLYNLPPPPPGDPSQPHADLISHFLSASKLPRLPQDALDSLNREITVEEIAQTILMQKTGKSPGPDGFTALYYKKFSALLSPHLHSLFNGVVQGDLFPPEMLEARIVVIPKEGKDPLNCASYRPISLLNLDLKIFAKILATRLNPYLPSLVHYDQSQAVAQESDISRDVESVPVSFCNEIDNTRPSPFAYRKSPWPRGYSINNFTDLFIGCCDCTDGCLDVSTCACLQLTARACNTSVTSPKNGKIPGYTYKRLRTPIPTGLYECNVSCKCDRKMCQNRVVQHGLQVRLQVYKTKEKGFGVRCLDDLDKGTFVCIYAGRIFMKSFNANTEQDSNVCVMPADGNKTISIKSKRRRVSHSDSEITIIPSISTSDQKLRVSPSKSGFVGLQMKRKTVCIAKGGNLDFTSIKRPKTKTSMLQKRRRQLMEEGAVTLQHSSDDERSTPPGTPKHLHFSDSGDKQDYGESKRTVHTAGDGGTVQTDEAGYVSDESCSSAQLGVCPPKQAVSLGPSLDECTCILDASKEGNVARFFNHSCSPNLFVQQVFVETHCKSFPWVAFFTKSFLKAGTELTWEYNYQIGSAPENEIPCLCGMKACKSITI